jgi:hypothetical protein
MSGLNSRENSRDVVNGKEKEKGKDWGFLGVGVVAENVCWKFNRFGTPRDV